MLERTALLISVKHDLEGKRRGMACALSHDSGSEEMPDFPENRMERVAIIRLTASEITGKQHK